jgi:hypothetical protein
MQVMGPVVSTIATLVSALVGFRVSNSGFEFRKGSRFRV